MYLRSAARAATLFLSLLANAAWGYGFNALYVFGDSLSDAGNNPSALTSISKLIALSPLANPPLNCDPGHPCPPYFDGRFTNGPVAAEHLANAVLPGGGNPANYFSFAVAGATTGVGNFGDGGSATATGFLGLPGMAQELGLYQTLFGPAADPDALYMVWGGANDFLSGDSPIGAAQNIAAFVGNLATAGAEHILVPNLPDLSLTPTVQAAPALAPVAQGFSIAFNAELALQLGNLRLGFPTALLIEFDVFALFNDVLLNPGGHGLSNVLDACLVALVPCADPSSYLFWDDFHPTAAAHAVIAAQFASAVPEPGTVVLLLSGLLLVVMASGNVRRSRWRCHQRSGRGRRKMMRFFSIST